MRQEMLLLGSVPSTHTIKITTLKYLKYFLVILLILNKSLSGDIVSQNCIYENVYPDNLSHCYSHGTGLGQVSYAIDVFLAGICMGSFGGGSVTGNLFQITVQDKTITFGADFIINTNVTFKRCTLNFQNNRYLSIGGIDVFMQPNLTTNVKFEDCVLQACDGSWGGILMASDILNNGGRSLVVEGSTIRNADVGIFFSSGNQYTGNFEIINNQFVNCSTGIKLSGISPRDNELRDFEIKENVFNGGNFGLYIENMRVNNLNPLAISIPSRNDYYNIGTAIYANEIEGIRANNQRIIDCNNGIILKNISSIAGDNIRLNNNTIINIVSNGISIENPRYGSDIVCESNSIGGLGNRRGDGIKIYNSSGNIGVNIRFNKKIENFNEAIGLRKVSHYKLNLELNNEISGNNYGFQYLRNYNAG